MLQEVKGKDNFQTLLLPQSVQQDALLSLSLLRCTPEAFFLTCAVSGPHSNGCQLTNHLPESSKIDHAALNQETLFVGAIPSVCCEKIKTLLSTESNQDDNVTLKSMVDLIQIDDSFIHQMADGHQDDNVTLNSMVDITGNHDNVDHLAVEFEDNCKSCDEEEGHNDATTSSPMQLTMTSTTTTWMCTPTQPIIIPSLAISPLCLEHTAAILTSSNLCSNGPSKVKNAWDLILPLCTILAHARQSWKKSCIAPNVPQSHWTVSIAR